jgi:hypothetical protein
MKTITINIIFFLFTSISIAQNFTLSELIKINNYNLNDFDTYVTQRGYKYYEIKSSDFSDGTSYAFNVNGFNKAYITKFYQKLTDKEMVSFQTLNNTIYLKIKAELKTLGFKFIKTVTMEGDTFFDYKKGKIEVSLSSGTQEGLNGNKLTSYEISVTRHY